MYSNINRKYFDGTMKLCSEEKLGVNGLNYKRSLDRIIEKYSRLPDGDGAIEVDLNHTTPQTLKRYMSVSKIKLKRMEAQGSTGVSEESLAAQDPTGDSQLDFSRQDDGDWDDSNVSSSQFSLEEKDEEGAIRIDTSQLPEWSISVVDFQPEDQDEELEMSLRSNATLMELYPGMITRLEQAWRRHNVSEAADLVRRRYRKWRLQLQKSHLNDTFNTVTLRRCRPTDMARESSSDAHLQPPVQAEPWSPGRGRSPQRRTKQWPAIVMDFSENSRPSKAQRGSPDQTFNVPEPSCSYAASPAKQLSLPHPDRTDTCSSPARLSPFPTRKPGSPLSFPRSPRVCLVRVKPAAAQKLLFPQEAPVHRPLSPQPATAAGRDRLGRHLSLVASLLSGHMSYTAEDLDEDFKMLYHRTVCQSDSLFFNSPLCRYCAKNPDARKNPSSSSLAALALSPHRSLLRKRACEESAANSPGSKRSRVQSYASSPGSKRYNIEMLKRRLSLAEPAPLRLQQLKQPAFSLASARGSPPMGNRERP